MTYSSCCSPVTGLELLRFRQFKNCLILMPGITLFPNYLQFLTIISETRICPPLVQNWACIRILNGWSYSTHRLFFLISSWTINYKTLYPLLHDWKCIYHGNKWDFRSLSWCKVRLDNNFLTYLHSKDLMVLHAGSKIHSSSNIQHRTQGEWQILRCDVRVWG